MTDLIKKLEAFTAANDRSPVVSGAVVSREKGGAHYRLLDGSRFTLNADVCRALPDGYPKWMEASNAGR